MKKIKAKDIQLYRQDSTGTWRAVAVCSSCNLDISKDLIEVCGIQDSANWKDYRVANKSWTISAAQFVVSMGNINDALLDSKVAIRMSCDDLGYCQGQALISSLQLVAQGAKGMATYNMSLKGCGALTLDPGTPVEPQLDGYISVENIYNI